jgi:hypothetical protein
MSSCDDLFNAFSTYTIEVRNYDSSALYTIQYRESVSAGTENAWENATLKDEDGNSLWSVRPFSEGSGYIGYFELPGKGTYDLRALGIGGDELGEGIEEDCSVTTPDEDGEIGYYTFSVSDSLQSFN